MQGKKKDKKCLRKTDQSLEEPWEGRRGRSKVIEEAGVAQVERTRRTSRSEELPW